MEYRLQHIQTGVRGAGALRLTPIAGAPAKCVVLLHGLTGSKESALPLMYALAEAGFDTVAPDLFLHGERPGAQTLHPMLEQDLAGTVFRIIDESAADIPGLCREVGVDLPSSGIVGVSCGGFVAHALAVQRPQFKAMVALISSPDWLMIDPKAAPPPGSEAARRFALASPLTYSEQYPPIALCQLNGLADDVVAPVGAPKLHEALRPLYERDGAADRLDIGLYDDIGHQVTEEMVARTILWLRRWL